MINNTHKKISEYYITRKQEIVMTSAYLLAFLVAVLTIALNQPLKNSPPLYGNPPDEHAHYLVPQYIYNHGTLPSGFDEEVQIPGYGSSYAIYNVLPYIIMGFVMRFVGMFGVGQAGLLISARCVSAACGLIMAFVVRRISKRLFRDDRFGWLFSFAIMFLPQHLFLHTYVNTDSMCMMSISIILYALIALYQDGPCRKNAALLALGVIICALTYYNAYGFILGAIILFVLYFVKDNDGKKTFDYKTFLHYGIPIAVAVLIGIGWWFGRNAYLYDGDILGLDTGRKIQEKVVDANGESVLKPTLKESGVSVFTMIKSDDYVNKVIESFICAYGSMSVYTSVWIYRLYELIFTIGILGYLATIVFYKHEKSFRRIAFHLSMIMCIIIPIVLLLIYAHSMDYQYQGRYIMPILIPFMYYVVMGILRVITLIPLKGKRSQAVITVLSSIGITIVLAVAYYVIFANAMPVYKTTGMAL